MSNKIMANNNKIKITFECEIIDKSKLLMLDIQISQATLENGEKFSINSTLSGGLYFKLSDGTGLLVNANEAFEKIIDAYYQIKSNEP